jgi:hypothetical protein
MKHVLLAGLLTATLGFSALAAAQQGSNDATAAGTVLGSVTLHRKVLADGQPLAAGTYQVRLGTEELKPAAGESPGGERYVEFVQGGKVVGREVATVISNQDMTAMGKYPNPPTNSTKVELLKGADYLRVWINKSGTNYLIHLPPSA